MNVNIIHKIFEQRGEKLKSISPLSGGNINDVYLVQTFGEKRVIKLNSKNKFPEMFSEEQKGLGELKNANAIGIPESLESGNFEDKSFLILEYVESGHKTPIFWENFGIQLNKLHQVSNEAFGFSSNNYIGSLSQSNQYHSNWSEFYALERLEPQLKSAIDKGYLKGFTSKFENLYTKLENLFPIESPCLIHGDLWSGNFIASNNDSPYLIDPAVYYGHREMDIGMSMLFGGFDKHFYECYNAENPLENKWQERVPLTQLYPLLVHVNLFGEGYVSSVKSVIDKFT